MNYHVVFTVLERLKLCDALDINYGQSMNLHEAEGREARLDLKVTLKL